MATRILIADDHEVVRQGLRSFLEPDADLEVVGEAADGDEAVRLARRLRPDVAVFAMDTALRLSDRVLPLLVAELGSGAGGVRRIERDLWALTSHLYVVSAKSDLVANVCRVLAQGLLALGASA